MFPLQTLLRLFAKVGKTLMSHTSKLNLSQLQLKWLISPLNSLALFSNPSHSRQWSKHVVFASGGSMPWTLISSTCLMLPERCNPLPNLIDSVTLPKCRNHLAPSNVILALIAFKYGIESMAWMMAMLPTSFDLLH